MFQSSSPVIPRKTAHIAKRLAQLFSKRKLLRAAHVMGPTLTALMFAGLSRGIAYAQGTMDFSGAQTLMGTFQTFAIYAGAVICFGGLIFAGIRMMSGRFQDAIPGLFGALFGAGVLGWGAGWIGTRLAYVAVSRASDDVRIYTNDAESLGQRLATDISKTAAVDFRPPGSATEVQQAIAAFRADDPAAGTAKLQNQGRVHEYASPEHRLAAISLAYTAQEDRAVIVAFDGAERRELTQLVRDELRQQGRLASESRAVPVLVEQHFGNPRLAANYAPGDQIYYKAGSPARHGIADNSTAKILSVDARANTLTVVTLDGNKVTYNPAILKKQTGQSIVYREEQRDLVVGERIRFTLSDHEAHIRSGDFATVERIGEDNVLSVRLDTGKSLVLDSDHARHIEYGYAVESVPHASVDRVLIMGDASQLAKQRETLARLSPHIRDLALYASDSRELTVKKAIPGAEVELPQAGISLGTDALSMPSTPEIEVTGFGIGL